MSKPPANDDQLRLEELFANAADLPTAEQAGYVAHECGDNTDLRDELLRLLAAHAGEDHLQRLTALTAEVLAPDTRIGAYQLIEKLGEGGMGAVYAARQTGAVDRRVALKLIKPGMDSVQMLARFEGERQALARMAHPNVAQVYDGGTTPDGRPFFTMELVEGEPITSYCDRRRLTTHARLALFLQVCHGVQHAHVKGLIHRDLKPSNVLVTLQDGHAVPKIIDFGVARATTGRLTERSLHTLVGQIVGTLDYMSPEQADPTGIDLDVRSDVYSLGVILYQLLSGQLPFHHLGDDVPMSERQRAIREVDPPTPSTGMRERAAEIAPLHGTEARTLVRQLAGDLDWICMKALEKDPARRYQSAAELADDVQRHLSHEPVLAGRPGALYRARKFVRRHQVGVVAGVLIAAAFLVGGYGVVAGQLEARATKPFEDVHRLRVLVQRADEELFRLPLQDLAALRQSIADMESWLDEVESLRQSLSTTVPELQAELAVIEARKPWSDRNQARHGTVTELLAGLARLDESATLLLGDAEAVSQEHGWSVRHRLAVAHRLETGFADGGDYERVWQASLPAINQAYPGLNLTTQIGLLPLGEDPRSHLWEFADLLTGEVAVRDANLKLVMGPKTGIVLVLIPRGSFIMGAQWTNENEANYDPSIPAFNAEYKQLQAAASEGMRELVQVGLQEFRMPLNFEQPDPKKEAVTVAPFFLSKFEMTQGQWVRCVGVNPSLEQPNLQLQHDDIRPVNQVDWEVCEQVLARIGLVLPHEEQWEYAARAHTLTPWWTGADIAGVKAAENLSGKQDGFQTVAPVGSFSPNPFGLYDVLGNVSEWCGNRAYMYGIPVENFPETALEHIARGGNSRWPAIRARASMRHAAQHMTHPALGLRPVRVIVSGQ